MTGTCRKRSGKRSCKRGGGQSGPGPLASAFGGRKRSGKRSCKRGGGPKFPIHGGGSTNFADDAKSMYGGGTQNYNIPGVVSGDGRWYLV